MSEFFSSVGNELLLPMAAIPPAYRATALTGQVGRAILSLPQVIGAVVIDHPASDRVGHPKGSASN